MSIWFHYEFFRHATASVERRALLEAERRARLSEADRAQRRARSVGAARRVVGIDIASAGRRLTAQPAVTGLAGRLAAAAFVALAVLQVYWALGGTWGLRAALGDGTSVPPTAVLWLAVALPLAAALVVLGRMGAWGERVPGWIFLRGARAIAVALVPIALGNFAGGGLWEVLLFGPLSLLLAALCGLVALSPFGRHARGRPGAGWRPRRDAQGNASRWAARP